MKIVFKKIIGALIVITLLTSTNIAFAVSQSDINNQKKQQEQNDEKQKELKDKQDEVKEIKDETLKEVEKLNTQINDYQSQITSLDSQIDDANVKIKEAEQKLVENQKEYEEKQELFKQRLVTIYESGETTYLDFLLSSQSLTDFISNYYLVSEVAEMDVELIEKIEKQKEEIEEAKKQIESSKNELTTAKASKENVAKELKDVKSQKDAKVSQLSAEEQKIQSQIEEIQKDNASINKKIQSMQAELKRIQEEEAKKNENKPNNKPGDNNNNSNTGSTGGASSAGFIRPVNSYITTGLYYSSGAYHGAVDFGASGVNGMPVYAVADGIVVTTQALTTSYGNYIIIYHPKSNLYTLYAHGQAGSIRVSALQTVKQGQQIMNVGSTGNSSGPHLHFEVRKSPGLYNNRVDPRAYLP